MDTWLASIYGTGGAAAQEDLEKIAQAEMAQQMAQQEGLDLNNLSPEQIEALGQEVLGGEQGGPQQPGQPQQQMGGAPQQPGMEQGGGEIDPSQLTDEHVQQAQQILEAAQSGQQVDPGMLQEAQAIMQIVEQMQGGQQQAEMAKVAEASAKFEEADLLGRVMAHAFNQESEKIAAAKLGPANAMGVARHHVNQAAGAVKHHVGNAARHVAGKAQELGGHAKLRGAALGHQMGKHPVTHGVAAAGGAALGAGAHHMMSKEASVLEKAAMQQAANILQANGIDPATGQPVQQQTPQLAGPGGPQAGAPQQDPQAAVGGIIEKRAYQILRNLGWNI